MESLPMLYALVCITLILWVGDVVSIKSKALISSVFVCAVLFLIGYWTFFPQEIVAQAGINTSVATLCVFLTITNMGTFLSIKELIAQWKTICISLAGIVGVVVLVWVIVGLFFDKNTAIVAIPPLVGGVVSSVIMSTKANELGLTNLGVFAVVIYVMQGFAGYPLTSYFLSKEAKITLDKIRGGSYVENMQEFKEAQESGELPQLLKFLPENLNTTYFKFFRLAIVAALAFFISTILKPIINIHPAVLCLVFGVIASSIGFLEKEPLRKANAFGFTLLAIMLFVFDGLKKATPQMLLDLAAPLFVSIVAAVIGILICSFVISKILKVSPYLSFSVALTALYGFPADYIITKEVINSADATDEEKILLEKHMIGPMLVGGFISVTIVSVVLAGVMVEWLAV